MSVEVLNIYIKECGVKTNLEGTTVKCKKCGHKILYKITDKRQRPNTIQREVKYYTTKTFYYYGQCCVRIIFELFFL